MRPRLLMICRGSSDHGLGHVMRTRTVASCLARRLQVAIVALGETAVLTSLLQGRNLTFRIENDPGKVLAVQSELQPDIVVFDAIDFPEPVLLELRRRAMLVSLSPAFSGQAHMDLLFHRTKYLGRELGSPAPPESLRCGLEYVVLRENCLQIGEDVYERNLARQPLSIAISMGGVDAGNNTLRLLASISQLAHPLLVWVLLGEGYAHSYQALVDCTNRAGRHEIILAKTTDSLWRVLETSSLAILAGGVTTYEAAFARLPSINVLANERGPILVQELVEAGVCLAAGPPFASALPAINTHIARLEQSRGELLNMHRHCHGLIDGHGAERIAHQIEAFFANEFVHAHPERRSCALQTRMYGRAA